MPMQALFSVGKQENVMYYFGEMLISDAAEKLTVVACGFQISTIIYLAYNFMYFVDRQ